MATLGEPLLLRAALLGNSKLALTNLVFLHPLDFEHAVAGDGTLLYVPVAVFATVFLAHPNADVTRGTLQMNQVQRRTAHVALNDDIPLFAAPPPPPPPQHHDHNRGAHDQRQDGR
jgi:hypothetical protein